MSTATEQPIPATAANTTPDVNATDLLPADDLAGADMAVPTTFAEQMRDQLLDFLQVGGPVVWILGLFSVIALTIVLIKLWQFALLRPESRRDVESALSLWRIGKRAEAQTVLKPQRPVSELTGLAMKGLESNSPLELLKEELSRVASQRLAQLRSWLRALEVIASLSPLLGLLGTVLGMIAAFQQMEAAGNQVDPSVLSGGIWQALLTTAVGLAVAIPVVSVHSWLERKVERIAAAMNDAVTQVFTSAHGVSLAAINASIETGALRDAA